MFRFSIHTILMTLLALCPLYGAAKFAPPEGKVILFVGQDVETIDDYLKDIKSVPAGYMCYTNVMNLEGLERSYNNEGGGVQDCSSLVVGHPNMVLQIGLYMVDELDQINTGRLDLNIRHLAAVLKSFERPVYLRVGYEFDESSNHYEPEAYKKAFRRVVDLMRKAGADNVAFVWHSNGIHNSERMMAWYPGDDYVDWVGMSYFDQFPKIAGQAADIAQILKKPLMLGETSAWHMKTADMKLRWLSRLFEFIDKKKVSALCFINCNWDAQLRWAPSHFGDTRVQSDPAVQKLWIETTAQDQYLKSSPQLFDLLGFKKNQ